MRRRKATPRRTDPDPKYGSVDIARFINRVMYGGKKTVARKIVYDALALLEKEGGKPALELFETATKNATPAIEVRARRVGGATYQVPHEVRPRRQLVLGQRWIIAAARQRRGRTMAEKLSKELLEATRGLGAAVKKREDTHKMAEANRAFVHHRW